MPGKVWIDGKLLDKNDAKVSVFDHGLLFGDGVAEGMRAYGGHVFRLNDHLARLYDSADFLSLTIPLGEDELARVVGEVLAANGRTEGYVRVMVTRGPGTLGLDPRKCEPAVVVIAEDVVDYPRELYDAGLDVITTPAVGFIPGVTLLSRPADVLAKTSALKAGCLDAILYGPAGEVLGSTDGCVFVVKDGALWAHPGNLVARTAVIGEARAAGLAVVEEQLTLDDLTAADEVFLASTAAEVIGVARIDGRPVGSGEGSTTRRVRELYREAARRPPVDPY